MFWPASFAVALAIIVFPQPGGPYNKTPIEKKNYINIYSLYHLQNSLITTEWETFVIVLLLG